MCCFPWSRTRFYESRALPLHISHSKVCLHELEALCSAGSVQKSPSSWRVRCACSSRAEEQPGAIDHHTEMPEMCPDLVLGCGSSSLVITGVRQPRSGTQAQPCTVSGEQCGLNTALHSFRWEVWLKHRPAQSQVSNDFNTALHSLRWARSPCKSRLGLHHAVLWSTKARAGNRAWRTKLKQITVTLVF